jgi:hypothetical protein
MKLLTIISLWFITPLLASAQTGPTWLRYPAISPDGKTIVFTFKGDLYTVPSEGRQRHHSYTP